MRVDASMNEAMERELEQTLDTALRRMSVQGLGIAVGLLLGLALFVATLILVVKDGPNVGQHLGLLRVYFPGYRVTVLGSFIGFVYAFVLGYGIGRTIGTVYNRLLGSR